MPSVPVGWAVVPAEAPDFPFSPEGWGACFGGLSACAEPLGAGAPGFAGAPFDRLKTPRNPLSAPALLLDRGFAVCTTTPSRGAIEPVVTG